MARDDDRPATGNEAAQNRPNRLTRYWIDGLEGLVENEDGRIGNDGAGQTDFLGHTGGVVADQSVRRFRQSKSI